MTAANSSGKLLVIARRCGRLANRTVLFANFIAFAQAHGHRVVNVTFHSYADLFETTRRDLYCRFPAPARRSRLEFIPGLAAALRRTRLLLHAVRGASNLNEKFPLFGRAAVTLRENPAATRTLLEGDEVQQRIRDARTVFAYGWNFRAPAAMRQHADVVRNYFRPVAQYERASRAAVESLRRDADVVVGVHIRRGDYRIWKRGKYFYEVARYAALMREVAEQFPGRKVSFLVCGDEPRRAEEFPGLKVSFGGASPVTDLFALAGCDRIIGPPSTFTQWASFYGNKPLYHIYDPAAAIALEKFSVSFLDDIPGS